MQEQRLKIIREHSDILKLGKRENFTYADWKALRTSLSVADHPDLVVFMDTLVNEQDFEDFVNNVIYG